VDLVKSANGLDAKRDNQHRTADAVIDALTESLSGHIDQRHVALDIEFLGNESTITRRTKDVAYLHTTGATQLLVVRLLPSRIYLSLFALPMTPDAFTACPECFDRRLASALTLPEQESITLGFHAQTNDSPFLLGTLLENAALLAKRILSGYGKQSTAKQRVFALKLLSQQVTISDLLPDSFCGWCQTSNSGSAAEAVLPIRQNVKAHSGKGRIKGLEEYNLPLQALVNPVCGAAGLNAIPGYAQSVTAPVYGQYAQRGFNVAPRLVSWSGLCTRTDESRTAGVLEALERQAGMLAHPERTAVFDSYRNISADAMDPTLCFAYNDQSYSLPLGLSRYNQDTPLAWVWGYSLLSERPILVPKQLVYYDRIPATALKLVDNNSSGCALGACYEEAILRGLFELLERDAFVIAWYRQIALPRIDPATCLDRKTRLILDRVKLLGYDIALLDARLDIKIPAVIAIGRRRDNDIGSMVVGASANTDAAEAIRSALLEAATSIVEVPSLLKTKEEHVRNLTTDYLLIKTVADHGLLYGLPEMAEKVKWLDQSPIVRSMNEAFPPGNEWHSGGDIAADLRKCLAELERCGVQDVVAVDLTTREQRMLDLKTIRMIVPGLGPIDFGFPRNRVEKLPRLYSAPAAARLSPIGEDRINPLPHPFP